MIAARAPHPQPPAPPLPAPSPLDARRLNWIRLQRLSPAEVAELPEDFDPGPEFDPQETAR